MNQINLINNMGLKRGLTNALIFLIAVAALGENLQAQTQSPFELRYRLKDIEVESQDTVINTIISEDTPTESLESPIVKDSVSSIGLIERESDQDEDKPVGDRNMIFWLLLFLLIILTLTISVNRSLFGKIYKAVINDNYLNFLMREQKQSLSPDYWFLYIMFVINIGILIYLFLTRHDPTLGNLILLACILFVGLIYLVRHSIMRLFEIAFPVEKEIRQYDFTIVIFNIFLGLLLFPVNAAAAFSGPGTSAAFIYIGIGLVILIYIFRQLRGLFIGLEFVLHNKFHFFLYLCTVEIAPLLILGKFILSHNLIG